MERSNLVQQRWQLFLLSSMSTFILSGCQKNEVTQPVQTIYVYVDSTVLPPNSIQDVDGNIYSTVQIGAQRWMKENLRSIHYSNGDLIAYGPQPWQWAGQGTGVWAHYDSDSGNDAYYGKLYNWFTVLDPRNACPDGWHVPSDSEWMDLEQTLGVQLNELETVGSRGELSNAGGKLKATEFWKSPNIGANDSTGFRAYPGGQRSGNASFLYYGSAGVWWTSTEKITGRSWMRQLWSNDAGIRRVDDYKNAGASIRCIED